MTRLAVISDIHGNRWALEAVLEDIHRRGVPEVVNLGDVLYGPLDPAGTADILIDKTFPTVQGNEDRIIIDERSLLSDTSEFVRGRLSYDHLEWLKTMQPTLELREMFLFHGTPESDTTYLLHEVRQNGVVLRQPAEVVSLLKANTATLILCGHDHIPGVMQLPDGRTVVNPGSVGLPSFSDDQPYPHIIETGAPHARYAIVEMAEQGWRIDSKAIPYDWQCAADAARKNGRADWAAWLQTGRS